MYIRKCAVHLKSENVMKMNKRQRDTREDSERNAL